MFKQYCAIIIVMILPSFIITGCWDSTEVDDNVYAIVLGVDKGENNKLLVTVQCPAYTSSRGNQGGAGVAEVNSIEAPSILEGINLMNMAVSRRVSMVHTKMLVISEELAREGISDCISTITRFSGTRRTMFVVVTKGKAVDFIKENKTEAGESITKSIELMMAQSKNTDFFPYLTFHEFYKDITSTYGNTIAIYAGVNTLNKVGIGGGKKEAPLVTQKDYKPGSLPRTNTIKREFVGTALFNGDKMVGSLNPYETRCLLMITGKFHRGMMTIEDKKSPRDGVVLSIRLGRNTKIKGKFKNNKPVVDVFLNVEADIGTIQSRINYESVRLIGDLNKQLETKIKKEVEKTIAKTKDVYKVDVFQFGKEFAAYFPMIQEWEAYDWLTHYPETKVNVHVEANVRRTGLVIDSSPINRGKESK